MQYKFALCVLVDKINAREAWAQWPLEMANGPIRSSPPRPAAGQVLSGVGRANPPQ